MIDFWNSLSTDYQITIILAIIGWSVAIWQSIVAYKHKKASVIFENRINIYNDYFQKIDGINERLMIDFQEFIGPTIHDFLKKVLENPNGSNQYILELQKALDEVQIKASKTISQAEQELQKLRFIATERTLEILNRYRDLAKLQLECMCDVYESIDLQNHQSFDVDQNQKLVQVGKDLISTKNELEKQMKKDLGIK